jgi:hypothetical protein
VKKRNRIKPIKTSFTGGNLTNYSGIYPMFKFMQKMGINHLFEEKISIKTSPNQKYFISQIFNAILLGVLSGMNRLIKIENFTLDPLVRYLLEIEDKLDAMDEYHLLKISDWVDDIADHAENVADWLRAMVAK